MNKILVTFHCSYRLNVIKMKVSNKYFSYKFAANTFLTIYIALVIIMILTKFDIYSITIFGCETLPGLSSKKENNVSLSRPQQTLSLEQNKLRVLIVAYPRFVDINHYYY